MNPNTKTIWYRFLVSISTLVLFVATHSVCLACEGTMYQPVVPDQLRQDE